MNSICAYCRYVNKSGDYYVCYKESITVVNYITGRIHVTAGQNCNNLNSDGKCQHYAPKFWHTPFIWIKYTWLNWRNK